MKRQDLQLAPMLQFENIAWYEDGVVRILDRRIYPIEKRTVECHTHREVAQAITDMVTQSAGPYVAAAMGMALAAYECREQSASGQIAYLEDAARTIANARPTTAKRMNLIVRGCLDAAGAALEGRSITVSDERFGSTEIKTDPKHVPEAIRAYTVEINNLRYARIGEAAKHLAARFPEHGNVMTQCFAETIVGQMLKEARLQGKDIRLFTPETRPYFQGSRLTATVIHDMGFDVTVITDNMPAAVMKNEGIDVFTCAADVICGDGHVINKVGTYQISIAAKYHSVPVYVSGAPDVGHATVDTVRIEMREPSFVLQAMGTPTANPNVHGYYPAFDITPPELITGIATDQGILSPFELDKYVRTTEDMLV